MLCAVVYIYVAYLTISEVAVPDGEAHRHEPPIPHDKVQIEKNKNQQELDEEKNQAAGKEEEELAEQGAGQQQELTEDKVKNEVAHKKQDAAIIHVAQDLANEIHEKVEEQKKPELVAVVHKPVEQPSLVKEQEAENRLQADKKSEENNKPADSEKREYIETTVPDILSRGLKINVKISELKNQSYLYSCINI